MILIPTYKGRDLTRKQAVRLLGSGTYHLREQDAIMSLEMGFPLPRYPDGFQFTALIEEDGEICNL